MPSRCLLPILVMCALVAPGAIAPRAQGATGPQVGDVAPDFSLPGTDGRTYTLAEFRGVRPVVIAWFPKAFAKV
jgi:peroxiredoxin Q/BCP